MLGDTAEKTKNPLKKAMRRRNAKTVTFTAPTYVEASDYDYSSDEDDDDDELFGGADPTQVQNDNSNVGSEPEQEEGLKVQPLKVNGAKDGKGDGKDDVGSGSDESLKTAGDKAREDTSDRPRKLMSPFLCVHVLTRSSRSQSLPKWDSAQHRLVFQG